MVELTDLRNNLIDQVPNAWNTEEAIGFANDLRDAFGSDAEDVYEDCVDDQTQSLTECLEDAAEDEDVDSSFENQWGDVPDELLTQLRQVSGLWDSEARNQVRDIALANDLDSLHRDCANANYDQVQDDLGLDSPPNTFRECVDAVAEAQDMRSDLKEAWGTNGG